jgi:xanthine dehydrogenase accessory factor
MLWRELQTLQDAGIDAVVVTVIAARGSVPTDLGSKMVVTAAGLHCGTVGGGRIESRTLERAGEILRDSSQPPCQSHCWNLQRDIGMTCGGEMTLLFEVHRAVPAWRIFIFGAGHVVQALIPVLIPLACRITVFDVRKDWLERLPVAENLTKVAVARFEDGVSEVTANGFVLSITKGHATDLPVLREVFTLHPGIPFIGVIGSASKRATLTRELLQSGISEEMISRLICPLGLRIGGNAPAEIAISIAAQLLEKRREALSGGSVD